MEYYFFKRIGEYYYIRQGIKNSYRRVTFGNNFLHVIVIILDLDFPLVV
jgi:hypothetical protein